MYRKAKQMFGWTIHGTDDVVGKLHDLYFDDEYWSIRYLVVETGGWLSRRRVLVSPFAVDAVAWDEEMLSVELTRERVENGPDIDLERPVSGQQFIDLHDYYGWPAYWAGSSLLGTATVGPYPFVLAGAEAVEEEAAEGELDETYRGDPHLRSVREVVGYHIAAEDGEMGHVSDFLVDYEEWVIRFLEVDTRDFLPGRHVLIAPRWVVDVDWAAAEVRLALTREQVKDSPEYDADRPVTTDYERQLFLHYGFGPPTR